MLHQYCGTWDFKDTQTKFFRVKFCPIVFWILQKTLLLMFQVAMILTFNDHFFKKCLLVVLFKEGCLFNSKPNLFFLHKSDYWHFFWIPEKNFVCYFLTSIEFRLSNMFCKHKCWHVYVLFFFSFYWTCTMIVSK